MVLDKRRLVGFVICTFLFTYTAWGLIIAADRFGLFGFNTPAGTLLYICGTWAPTLFSYFILKQNKTIHTMKDFIKLTFSLKAKPKLYVLAFIFLAALYIPAMIGSGTNYDIGGLVWLPIFPLMILDGGMGGGGVEVFGAAYSRAAVFIFYGNYCYSLHLVDLAFTPVFYSGLRSK